MRSHIIERIPGMNNYEMLRECELLRDIMLSEPSIKKNKKYKVDQESLDRIIRSCEYYKALHDGDSIFRDYQKEIIKDSLSIIKQSGFVYLAMEVRTGKTLTSLGICSRLDASNVLFLTKKKAISSIEEDYKRLSPSYHLTIINYESLHHVMNDRKWDVIICDEAHSMGAFPKPSKRGAQLKQLIQKQGCVVILLSGTPTPESYSQMYHQVYGIPGSPFYRYKNFYRFCEDYVIVKEKHINGLVIKDYSHASEKVIADMKPYTINYSQQDAGFITKTTENILYIDMHPSTYSIAHKLKQDKVVEGKQEVILADTPVKLMTKLHQIYSGTIKFESGNSMVIDTSKAKYIREKFSGKKIGIFYKFKEELSAIKSIYGDDITTELSVFEDTNKSIALQIVSGREGISLKQAECLVYYNIDFSATSYWQSKERMTTKDRPDNIIYWIFSNDGIEKDIYKAVIKKKDYTINHFKKYIDA
jgi:superfamily II DNA or RNA helicase